ncbi:hypothetical protein CRG98_010667 [Punica granatum]|uniref:Uncharacterized protein n=1 Tax=Punica granatum TaxID=22663 RepID=A0A2I0KKB9_PUNGR|nr:hypothetical protein CRG98_010667 [Punica granatum]
MRCRKVRSHELADRARLHKARARWLGELAVQQSKLARVSGPGKVAMGTSVVVRLTCGAGKSGNVARGTKGVGSANLRRKKVSLHGLAYPARLQEARARWFGELGVQESKLARKTRQGCKKHERGGSANLRSKRVNSHGLADPSRLQEARARWLGELAVQESGSANLRCTKVNSHGLADPARLQEARARRLGELSVQESYLARISKPGKVPSGTSEVARRTCGAGRLARTGKQTRQGCKRTSEVARRTCGARKLGRTG